MPISGISTISSKRTIFVFEIVTSATLKKKPNKYDSSIDKRSRVKKVFKTISGRDIFF